MKSIINKEEEKKDSSILYPCLMQGSDGAIVLFDQNECGVCVHEGRYSKIGYADDWIMSKFTPFKGSITLSNE